MYIKKTPRIKITKDDTFVFNSNNIQKMITKRIL